MGHVYATREGAIEARESLANPSDDLVKAILQWVGGGMSTGTGKSVSPDSALRGTVAVYACVRVLSESVGMMPFLLYRDRGHTRERIPPVQGVARVLHQQANPVWTSAQFWESMTGIAALWGNSYALIVRGADGIPRELWILHPDTVEPIFVGPDGKLADPRDPAQLARGVRRFYIVRVPGKGEKRILEHSDVLHVPALAIDSSGLGVSPVSVARQTIAAAQSQDEFEATFYANNATPGGIIKVEGKRLQDDDIKRYRAEWEKLHRGFSNRHRVAVMDANVSWQSVGMPLKDAQFVETKMQDALAIARVFRVQPHMIGILDRATWGNIEHQGLDFLVHGTGPWVNRIEGAVNRDLGSSSKTLRDQGFIPEFLAEALLRMDTKGRFEAYSLGRRMGVLSGNDIRHRENLEPIPSGDRYMVSADMVALDDDGVPIGNQAPATPEAGTA